jgi:RpiR family transcriptional regulator, carbohydrate utilization regulator
MLDRIKALMPTLPPAEQRVALVVLQDPRAFASQSIAILSEQAGVSKPTVVRFCRSLGYEGLPDFKLKLAGSLSEGVPFVHRAVGREDHPSDVITKVIDNTMSAMIRYRNDVSSAAMQRALDLIAASKTVQFYGVGNSGIVALDAQHKFFRLGLNAVAHPDSHIQLMSASMLSASDCVIAISNSGRSSDLLQSVEVANRKGASTIAITATGSPLAQSCKVLLAADHPEDYDRYSPMVSRILHLMIVDILATNLALRSGERIQPILAEMKQTLKKLRKS